MPQKPDLFTRLIRFFLGIGVGGAIGFFLTQGFISESDVELSDLISFISIILFSAGLVAGLFSYPGDARPFTIKLALFVLIAGVTLSAALFFLGFGMFEDMEDENNLEGIGLLIVGLILIAFAIVGAISTVIGAVVLVAGSIIGESLAKSLFYKDTTFDNPKLSSSTKYCQKCGGQIKASDRTCPSCGNKV